MSKTIILTVGIFLLCTLFHSSLAQSPVPLQWNETQLNCIRKHVARPTVHARNLFHCSLSMYDAWAVYDPMSEPFLLGNTWGNFNCPFNGITIPTNEAERRSAQEEAMSYAMYRTLKHRYLSGAPAANYLTILGYIEAQMDSLGYDENITSTDYSDGDPAKLGNYIAAKIQEFALQDGSNQQANYANQYYTPINGVLAAQYPGNPYCEDPNRWQPLYLSVCTDQSTPPIVIPCSPTEGTPALSPEWGNVTPFSLRADQATDHYRDGNLYRTYLDPGSPPYLDTLSWSDHTTSMYKYGFVMNIIWHSFHNNDDGVMIDASPNSVGGLNFTDVSQLPQSFEDYQNFYNLMEGGVDDPGHTINPATGAPYEVQMVPRKDFTRVLSQYWADGPSSETPPGHWFKLFNDVSSNPLLQKRWMGQGEILDDMDWYVRGYFTVGAGVHDAAIACWGAKGYYDYTRPIMAIRWMGSRGQCTDSTLSNYHPAGLPLIPGYIEVVGENDPLALADPTAINKIKVFSWRGPVAATGEDGAGWLLAERWWTYQAATFVTPPFAGYYSGHSTYSRTAAEIMTLITGDEYFPGGMAEYDAPPGYLIADSGPSVEVKLQWATYRDASDQCSLSRIYGGLHPPQDDIPGRVTGLIVGPQVVDKANAFILANLFGCIDTLACNFNPIADSADASCVYPGCNQPTACNYNPLAGCESECYMPDGCTNSDACNFEPAATCDNGSCVMPGCKISTACNYEPDAICSDPDYCIYPACGIPGRCNYDSLALCIDNSICLYSLCSDAEACNYSPTSQCDDGNTCIYGNAGCIFQGACNYDSTAVCNSGTCIYPGCLEPGACNYNALAGCSDNSCVYAEEFYTCAGLCINDSDGDFVCDELEVSGCIEPQACNFNPLATNPTNTCFYAEEFYFCDGSCQFDIDQDGICDQLEIAGCVDTLACNFNPFVLQASDECVFPGCNDATACNFNSLAGCNDNSCEYPDNCGNCGGVNGCTESTACNYDSSATCNDSTCTYPLLYLDCAGNCLQDSDGDLVCDSLEIAGCQQSNACNFNPFATDSDETCVYPGCTDSSACNYAPNAQCEGQCLYPGCSDIMACNYSTDAACLDVSACIYPQEFLDCSGNCLQDIDLDGICDNYEIAGCMNSTACNYNINATDSSENCEFPLNGYDCNGNCIDDIDGDLVCDNQEVAGCTDVLSCNYNSLATDDDGNCITAGCQVLGACNYDVNAACSNILTCDFPGCGDINACNYNPSATCVNDSNCTYGISGCIFESACNFNIDANCNDGSCVYPGCTEFGACNYDPNAGCSNNLCIYADLYYDCSGLCLQDVDNDNICDELEITGCTNPQACNFNPLATESADTCYFPELYYTCSGNCQFDIDNDGICDALETIGCMDTLACNFNPFVFESDNSCQFAALYYDCQNICINDVDGDSICDELEETGCTDNLACNFNGFVLIDDGSCIYSDSILDCTGSCYFDSDSDGICDQLETAGCTDSLACNYNSLVTNDDGTCAYPNEFYDCNGACIDDADNDQICDPLEASGCTDTTACNYNAFVTNSDSSCTYPGCTDPTACNFNILAGCDDASCIQPNLCGECDGAEGCSDLMACNYSNAATCDNGSCIYPGCTNELACNYDLTAGCDDSSCTVIETFSIIGQSIANYDTFFYQYPGNPEHLFNWTINGGLILSGQGGNWVEVVWTTYGTLCVTEIAEDCNGETVCLEIILADIDDTPDKHFSIYPNPSNGAFTIHSNANKPFVYRLIDITAKTVAQGTITQGLQNVDFQHLPAGSYTLMIDTLPYRIIIE